jgi:uncharacterized protein DUF397
MDVRDINRTWIRSSLCGPQHNCVELSYDRAETIIRDSKGEPASVLIFDQKPWSDFVRSCGSAF